MFEAGTGEMDECETGRVNGTDVRVESLMHQARTGCEEAKNLRNEQAEQDQLKI